MVESISGQWTIFIDFSIFTMFCTGNRKLLSIAYKIKVSLRVTDVENCPHSNSRTDEIDLAVVKIARSVGKFSVTLRIFTVPTHEYALYAYGKIMQIAYCIYYTDVFLNQYEKASHIYKNIIMLLYSIFVT